MILALLRLIWKFSLVFLAIVVLYFAVTFVQVWLTSRHYQPRQAGAIVVMGAAQYDGVPSPDLAARLNQALKLYKEGYAHTIVVTGSKERGDLYTEAEASQRYLISKGVPADNIIMVGGSDSYDNLSDTANELRKRGVRHVLVVTDPFHEDRSLAIASDVGLIPSSVPTQTSPIKGPATFAYFLKETVGVGLGRIIGFNHLEWIHSA
jgi:uncharacterized SAM-binding protein YcdF (DUF218 family)